MTGGRLCIFTGRPPTPNRISALCRRFRLGRVWRRNLDSLPALFLMKGSKAAADLGFERNRGYGRQHENAAIELRAVGGDDRPLADRTVRSDVSKQLCTHPCLLK